MNYFGNQIGTAIGLKFGRDAQIAKLEEQQRYNQVQQQAQRPLPDIEITNNATGDLYNNKETHSLTANGNVEVFALNPLEPIQARPLEPIETVASNAPVTVNETLALFAGDNLTPQQQATNAMILAGRDVRGLSESLRENVDIAKDIYYEAYNSLGSEDAPDPIFALLGLTPEEVTQQGLTAARSQDLSDFQADLANRLATRAGNIDALAGRMRSFIVEDKTVIDDPTASFFLNATPENLEQVGRTSLGADLASLIPGIGNAISAGQVTALTVELNILNELNKIGAFSDQELASRTGDAQFDIGLGVAGTVLSGAPKVIGKALKGVGRVGKQAVNSMIDFVSGVSRRAKAGLIHQFGKFQASSVGNFLSKSINKFGVLRNSRTFSFDTNLLSDPDFLKRADELAPDAEQAKNILKQGIGGARYESVSGRTLSLGADDGVDFVDDLGNPLSLKGPLLSTEGKAVKITEERINGLAKAVIKDSKYNTAANTIVVDTLGLDEAQFSILKNAISLGANPAKQIIFVK